MRAGQKFRCLLHRCNIKFLREMIRVTPVKYIRLFISINLIHIPFSYSTLSRMKPIFFKSGFSDPDIRRQQLIYLLCEKSVLRFPVKHHTGYILKRTNMLLFHHIMISLYFSI